MFNRLISWLLPVVPKRAVGRVARRYISGPDSASAIALSSHLAAQGFRTTIDLLGEDTTTWEQAEQALEAYLSLMRGMVEAGVERNVSLKLTGLGLRLDPERAFVALGQILAAAETNDFFVRLDMEDATLTDATLALYARAREQWPRVGTVLQARLHRTEDDARRLGVDVQRRP